MDAPKLDKFKDTLNWAVDRNKFFGHGYGAVLVMFGDAIAEIERLQKDNSLLRTMVEVNLDARERYRKALEFYARESGSYWDDGGSIAREALKGDSHDQS